MANDIQAVVRCKKFELVDDNGKVRASIQIDDGDVEFQMFDKNGEVKAEINIEGETNETGLFFFYENGSRISLGLSKTGIPYLIPFIPR